MFEAISGISGWAPQTYFFGEPDLIDNYQKWDISEGHEIRSITAHADIDGNYLQYLQFVTRNYLGEVEEKEFGDRVTEFDDYESALQAEAADETSSGSTGTSESCSDDYTGNEVCYDGFYVTWDLTERFIGFSATTSKGAGQYEVANIRYLKPVTDKNNMCRETEEDYFVEYWIGEDSPDTIVDDSETESCDSEEVECTESESGDSEETESTETEDSDEGSSESSEDSSEDVVEEPVIIFGEQF